MSLVPPNFRALQSRAEYFVNAPFDDESISTFRDDVKWRIANYMAIVHQAGMHAAELVEQLPYAAKEGGFEDAFMGAYILRQTEQALRELLEEDEQMSEMIRAYYTTSDAADEDVRRKSRQFDRDHLSDLDDEFRQSAKGYEGGGASDGQIADSAAGGSRSKLDAAVDAAQDRRKQTIEVRVYEDGAKRASSDSPLPELPIDTPVPPAVSAPEEDGNIEDVAVRLFGEKPERIAVKAPDYSKSTPNGAFRAAIGWMVDHIIMVSSGSKNRGKYPRIAPLMIKQVPAAHAASVEEMDRVVKNIRHHASMLRAPNDSDDLGGAMRRALDNIDPKNPSSMVEAFRKLGEGLRRGTDSHRPDYADSAQEEGGGWREGDGEDWK